MIKVARRHSLTDRQVIGIISIIVGLLLFTPLRWLVDVIYQLVPYILIGVGLYFLLKKRS